MTSTKKTSTRKMLWIPALLLTLGAAGCAAPVPVAHEGLDTPRYTRVVFKPSGKDLGSSNYLGQTQGYPLGSKAVVTMYSRERIELSVNGIPHVMKPVSGEFSISDPEIFLTKYFVSKREDLGLESLDGPGAAALDPPTGPVEEQAAEAEPRVAAEGFDLSAMEPGKRQAIEQGTASIGMTKEQVFMALGPPVFVNFEQNTTGLGLKEIFATNRWVYFDNPFTLNFFGIFPHAYVFDGEGKLITILR